MGGIHEIEGDLINRDFLGVSSAYKGGEGVVWTCVKDNVCWIKEEYKVIRLCGFGYKLFEEEEGGGHNRV